MIDLTEIFYMQSEVDELIIDKLNKIEERKEKPKSKFGILLTGNFKWNKDQFDFFTFDKRKIAFNVELGELANELGFFKYWKSNHEVDRYRVKDEWADCLAFLISLIESKRCKEKVIENFKMYNEETVMCGGTVEREFKDIMYNNLETKDDFVRCLHDLFWMMGSLDYVYDELIEAYKNKTKENIRRAKEGY